MLNLTTYLKLTRFVVLFAFLGMSHFSQAQYMEFEWSDEYRFSNRKTGFFTEFIGRNQTSVYLLQRNISKSKPYDNSRLKIIALNRNSMLQDTMVSIKGYSENESMASTLDDLDFVTSVIADGRVVVFWRKLINTDTTRTEEIYGQVFKGDLQPATKITKVLVYKQEVEDHPSIFDPSMCVVLSDDNSDHLVVGTEQFKDGQLEFYYVKLSPGLAANKTGIVPLPQKPKSYPGRITSHYELRENKLFIRSNVDYTKEEKIDLWPRRVDHFPAFTVSDLNTQQSTSVEFRGNDLSITDFSYQVIGNSTRALGFYGDFSEDTTGTDKHGLFYVDIDHATMKPSEVKYVDFDRSTLNRLFPKKRVRKREKKGIDEDEKLASRFDIEHMETMSDNSLVFFFTREYNYTDSDTRSNLNGENVYQFDNFYQKKDIFAMRLNQDGEIMWSRSLEREITYQGADVSDLRVVYKYDEFFVLYGNEDAELKPPSNRKKHRHLTEELEYATFDPNSGRGKVHTTEVNEPKTPPKEKFYLDPNSAVIVDGQIYFYKMNVRQNPLWTAANIICLPTLYYTATTGNTMQAKAQFATMHIRDGKRPRRKR